MIATILWWISDLVCILWNVLVTFCTHQGSTLTAVSWVHWVGYRALTALFLSYSWWKATTLPRLDFDSKSSALFPFATSVLMCFLWQHYYKAGESLGEGGTPAERDLCGLCTLSVTHPAGQPWTGAAHRRYRCCIAQAVCGVLYTPPYHCMHSTGCHIDGCVRSSRCWQESHYFAHKLGVCHSVIKSAFPLIHLVTSVCFVFFMIHSTYWGLFLDVVFLNITTNVMLKWMLK